MKKLKQLLMLTVCICIIIAAAIVRDGKIIGRDINGNKETATEQDTVAERQLADGTIVINTTAMGKDIKGYAGSVPLEIYIKDGHITQVKALPNAETPEFFSEVEPILKSWNGKTPEEAQKLKVDAVTGATFSSRAVIQNMQRGLNHAMNMKKDETFFDKMDMSAKYAAGIIVVLMAAIIPLFYRSKHYRTAQLVLNVAVLGLWCGTFLSWSMFVGYMSGGINVWASLIPVIMLITAFIYPLFGKKQHYCVYVCPFGSAQDLASKANKKKWRLPQNAVKALTAFRRILFAVLIVLMLTGITSAWMDYELFTAFIWQAANAVVMVLAVIILILAVFIPRPYCRFVCPTGTLLKFI